ncbi:hypothetical protein HDU76_007575 [Blyttiomyces sp. JEL0837]|nr:hypothetical protein HDU76_007575 [Blyttiomyces sp. JEL0837]
MDIKKIGMKPPEERKSLDIDAQGESLTDPTAILNPLNQSQRDIQWQGVLFIHRGYYKEGVFKFRVHIPDGYPDEGPSVSFVTDMFHPLIDRDGNFSLRQQFPVWRPQKDFLCHVLHYIKNSFKEAVLANLEENNCPNREAHKMFNLERNLFAKLASQCAQLSASEGIIYDDDEHDNFLIKFTPLDDETLEQLKSQMINSAVPETPMSPVTKSAGQVENHLMANIKNVTNNLSRMLYAN